VWRLTFSFGIAQAASNVTPETGVNADTETQSEGRYTLRHCSVGIKMLGVLTKQRRFQIGLH
jgi:hypothetical protein